MKKLSVLFIFICVLALSVFAASDNSGRLGLGYETMKFENSLNFSKEEGSYAFNLLSINLGDNTYLLDFDTVDLGLGVNFSVGVPLATTFNNHEIENELFPISGEFDFRARYEVKKDLSLTASAGFAITGWDYESVKELGSISYSGEINIVYYGFMGSLEAEFQTGNGLSSVLGVTGGKYSEGRAKFTSKQIIGTGVNSISEEIDITTGGSFVRPFVSISYAY